MKPKISLSHKFLSYDKLYHFETLIKTIHLIETYFRNEQKKNLFIKIPNSRFDRILRNPFIQFLLN